MADVKTAPEKIGRALCKGILWTLGIVITLVLVVVAINAFDEDLSAEAKRLLTVAPNPWKAEQNLYLVLVGFDALPSESPLAVGQARIVAYDQAAEPFAKDPQAALANTAKLDAQERLQFVGKVDFCPLLTASCWTGMANHKQEIGSLLSTNQVLYQRYLALHRLEGYYETAAPSVFARTAYVPGEVRRLFLANTALRINAANSTKQRAGALADLYDDIGTWRRMLVGDGSLISKMLAIVSLQGDFALLADLIADPTVDTESIGHEIEAILGELDENDWKLRGIFTREFRVSAVIMDQLRRDTARPWLASATSGREQARWWEPYAGRVEGYFFKPGATENLSARSMLELQRVADSGAKDFSAARDAYNNWVKDNFDPGLKYAYNPIGRLLIAPATESYTEFLLRAYDVEAFVRLVRLGYEIRQQKLRAEDVEPFMRARPQWATHPVDGRSFAWDASKREVAMQPLAPPRFERRFSIPIWTADRAN